MCPRIHFRIFAFSSASFGMSLWMSFFHFTARNAIHNRNSEMKLIHRFYYQTSIPTKLPIILHNHSFILHIFRSHLVKSNSPDLALRLAHLDEQRRSAGALARKFRAGLYARASGEQRQTTTTTINISYMKKLIAAYHNNGARGRAIKRFSKGRYRYRDDTIHVATDHDAIVLMATQVFMEAAGCRFNAVRKLTVGEILAAAKVPEPCVACGEMTTHFRKHVRRCKKLKRRGDHLRKVNYSRAIQFFGHKVCMNVHISELSRSLPHLLACRF